MERRRFSLLDAMVLVAATALGMGLVRGHYLELQAEMPQVFTTWPKPVAMHWRISGIGLLLASWSLAMIGLQLIPPRPSFRRLARSPGFGASLASVFGIIYCFGVHGVEWFRPWIRGALVPSIYFTINAVPNTVVIAIASTWISLAAGKRSRRGRDWRDGMALAVACAWFLLNAGQKLAIVLRE